MNKLIICGFGGSGKDYLASKFKNKKFKVGIFDTDRPQRSTELNGVDYYFIDKKEFHKNNYFLTHHIDIYDWNYGITRDTFNNSDVLILTPNMIKQLPNDILDNCLIIYLDINHNIIEERLRERTDKDTFIRRYLSDLNDFRDIIDYTDLIIKEFN